MGFVARRCISLRAYPSNPSEIIPVLLECLKDEDAQGSAREQRKTLGIFGSKAEPAIPRLIELVSDGHERPKSEELAPWPVPQPKPSPVSPRQAGRAATTLPAQGERSW